MQNNRKIAEMLLELANYMEIDGENPFRANAYRRAGRAVENLKQPLGDVAERLETIHGIGKGTAAVIREIMARGDASLLQEYRERLPSSLMDLLQIPGLGPRSVKTLYQELNVTHVDELKQLIKERKVRQLPGFGPKSEQKLLESIKRVGERPERVLLGQALPIAEALLEHIQSLPGVRKASIAGSIRRMQETVKDIDLIVAATQPEQVSTAMTELPHVQEVVQHGNTKVRVQVQAEWPLEVDMRIVTPSQFATTLHHFTGSKEHNVRIRQLAKQKGWKVSEYGVEQLEDGKTVTFKNETQFYESLGLPYFPPELRQGRGEVDVAREEGLPALVTEKDIKGDLHLHSQWSDGHHSIREMAEAAKEKGYTYIAITDHSRSLRVANGLSIDDLLAQKEEIDKINEELDGITILAGVEMDILPDGRMDYPDEVLQSLDFVIASIHSSFQQDEETMTKRILQAMEHPHVHMIAHPTGRLINRRPGYAVDLAQVFKRAQETGTVLELNANPNRLDLSDVHLKRAAEEYKVKIAVNTDAHRIENLSLMRYGIGMARRGWLEAEHVLNTWPLDKLRNYLRMKGSNG